MSANEDFIKKLKQNAASKGASADKAHTASSRANTQTFSQQVQANYAKSKAAAAQIKANPSVATAAITPITMAQTAAGVAKGSIPNAFQNQKESGLDRAADIVSAGTSSLVGGAANAVRLATTGKYSPSGIISRGIDKINGTNYTEQNAANQKSFANKMLDDSLLYSQNAKRGLGKIGQAGVEIGSAATQIGLMALTGGVAGSLGAGSEATGALTKGLMAIQQAGQGAYDAEKAGAGEGTQALYGLLQGATVYATEGISNVGVLGKVFGNGAADSKLERASANAISKFIKSEAGRAVANRLATGVEAGLGEAFEQNFQDALTPVYQRLTYDKNAKLNAEDMIYNGLVAGAVGGIVGSAGKNNLKALETENDAKAAERLNAAKNTPPVENTTPDLSQVAPNLIKPTQNIAQEAAQAPTVNESAKEVKLPAETENALKTQPEAPETKVDAYQQSINEQESNIKTLEDKAEYERAINRNLYAEYRSTDVETRRPELIAEAAAQKAKVEAAENAVTKAQNELQAFKDAHTNEIQNKTNVEKTVGILSDLNGRFINENTLKEIEQIGALPKETAELRKAFDRAVRLQKKSDELYVELTNATSLKESIETQAKLDKVNAQLDTAVQTLKSAQDKIANYSKSVETETSAPKTPAPETKTSIFPEDSIGAKITTPKSNIPLKTSANTASVQNAHRSELGAANSGFDPYSHLQNEYGTIQPGENPSRVVDVPLKTSDDMKVSQGVRTALEAKATPDEAVGPIQDAVTAERFSFETIKDKDAAARSEATVSQKGYETALRDWTADVRSGKGTKDLVAQGQVLYNNAVNAGDYKTSVDILADLIKMSHNGAQVTQANRMLKKLDPQYQLYALERQSQHISEELEAKFKKSGFDGIKLDEDLVRQFHEAKTQEARDAVMDKLKQNVADQMPSSWRDKWDAWRYLSMLGNPRTHIRNIVGNAGFVPVREVKNIIGAGIEKATGSDRTKSVLTMKDHNLVKYALKDYSEVADSVLRNGKFNDLASDLNERRQIFKNRGLEALRKGNNKALDAEDVWFAKDAYARSLAGYYKANGITSEVLEGGKVSQEVVDKARAYSVKEAQKATYRDSNAFSDWISRIGKYHGDNKWAKAGSTAVDAILPFRRTPANILARAWEYSPGEFLNVLGGDIRKVKAGDMNASEMIDHISSGMTGTMLLGLGAYLASQGLLTGGKSDNDDEAALATQQGYQDYALNIGGKSITLDWLAPEALPLFTGAELYKTMQQKSDGKITLQKALTNFGNMAEPLVDMSMLQGVNDLIDSVKYSKGNGIFSIAATTAANYLSQGLPTLAGQLERVGEKERETTYIDKTSGIPTSLQYMLGKAANKIPGIEYQQRPYTDMFGQHESSGSVGERVANNLFNPAYVRNIKQDGVTDELSRLVNGKYMSGVPDLPDQKITYGGKDSNLDKNEYTKYAEQVGQLEHKYAASMINNRVYSSMTDEQKADYLKTIFSYAKDEAKRDYINKNGGKYESQMDNVYNAQQAGITPDDYYAYKKYLKDIDPDGGNSTQLQKTKAISKTDLTTQMKGKLWQLQNSTSNPEKNPYSGTLAQAGLAPSKTIEIMEAFDTIDDAIKKNYVKADKGPGAAQVKAAYLIQWLTRQGYNANQRADITDVFTTWQMIPVNKISKKATAFVSVNPMP